MRQFSKFFLFACLMSALVSAGCAKDTSQTKTAPKSTKSSQAVSGKSPQQPNKQSVTQADEKRSSPLSRAEVRTYQNYLKTLGYYNGGIDGLAGPRTRKAVSEFQKDSNLKVTGELDRPTTKELTIMLGT